MWYLAGTRKKDSGLALIMNPNRCFCGMMLAFVMVANAGGLHSAGLLLRLALIISFCLVGSVRILFFVLHPFFFVYLATRDRFCSKKSLESTYITYKLHYIPIPPSDSSGEKKLYIAYPLFTSVK